MENAVLRRKSCAGNPHGLVLCIVSLVVLFALKAVGGTLPSSYDLRTLGYVTPVKNQSPYGTCWAFGSLGALESALMKKEGTVFDLSENNMINMLRGNYFAFERKGNPDNALSYLVSWAGPTLEAIDTYPNPNNSRSRRPVRHVQNVFCINPRTSYLDNDGIKNALVKLGALAVGYYHDDVYYNASRASYYNNDSALSSSHAIDYRDSKWHYVTLVGWDDNYSRNNFSRIPAGNGAFIVKNSWGSGWGDGGYFYVSYYDNSFAWGNYLYSFAGVEETDNYDSIYQYDYLGMTSSLGGSSTTGWGAAMFVADEDSKISAAGFYALESNTAYTVYVYTGCSSGKPRSGKLVHSQSGKLEYPGFHTVPFSVESPVSKSQRFSIVLKITTPNNKYPIVYSDPDTAHYDVSVPAAGQTFYSGSGSTWTDFTKSSSSCLSSGQCCFCCKAYTRRVSGGKKLSSISISGSSTVSGGASAQFSCTATYSDGSTLSVAPTWTISEGSQYASVSGRGLVTGNVTSSSRAVTAMACYSEGGITKTAVCKFVVTAAQYVTITLDADGGDIAGPTSLKFIAGVAVGVLPTPTKKGYSFTGWWIPGTSGGYDSFGMPLIGFPSRQVLPETAFYSDTRIVAWWAANRYTVAFDANGGSGSMEPMELAYDGKGVVGENGCFREGYRLAGWATEPNGAVAYVAGDTVINLSARANDVVTLYAVWVPAYGIIFHRNDASDEELDEYDFGYGVEERLPSLKSLGWARRGYDFMGWATSAANATKDVVWKRDWAVVSTAAAAGGALDVYAVWALKPDYYAIRFIRNEGAGTWRTAGFGYGEKTQLPSLANGLGGARRGYDFLGWATSAANAAKGVVWTKDGSVVTAAAAAGTTRDFYAAWSLKEGCYAIEFIRNDGAGIWRTVGFNYGEKTRIPSVANGLGWARRGYDFKGWALTTADAAADRAWKGDWAYVATPVKAGEVLAVYAVWALKPGYYQVRFNKNDGTGKWRTLGFECGKPTKLSTIAGFGWERPGHTFKGWALDKANADAGRVWKPDGAWVTNAAAEDQTLSIYAIWE